MNRFITCIAIGATLVLTQSCSSFKSEQTAEANSDPHAGHSMPGMKPTAEEHNHSHAGHSMPDMKSSEMTAGSEAKLAVKNDIKPQRPTLLAINIQDKNGKAIAKFDNFQEKLMHLIVVSDDLQFFNHIHPTYKQNGRFEVDATFPKPGSYTLFSDYKPSGQKEQVSALKTQVPGKNNSSAATADLNRSKTFGDTKVNLTLSRPTIKAGEEVMLMFDLRDASKNQPLTDLQPYLGEKGHLVILRQTPTLTATDYIHAHAMADAHSGMVHFMTHFPQPGKYKLWGQFNRNGKIITADFWVNVV